MCRACRSKLVHPLDWEEARGGSWTVWLRCPDCGWSESGTYGRELVEALDQELDEGAEALLDDLRELTRANMAEAAEGFLRALWIDAVLPEDF